MSLLNTRANAPKLLDSAQFILKSVTLVTLGQVFAHNLTHEFGNALTLQVRDLSQRPM